MGHLGNFMAGCLGCNTLSGALHKSEGRSCTGLCDYTPMSTLFNSQSCRDLQLFLARLSRGYFRGLAPFLIPRAGASREKWWGK